MLAGQDLGRSHDGGLVAVQNSDIGGNGGTYGLTASHISYKDPAHGGTAFAGHIGGDLADGRLLRFGQLIREKTEKWGDILLLTGKTAGSGMRALG